jgi:YHS domain-containing protein
MKNFTLITMMIVGLSATPATFAGAADNQTKNDKRAEAKVIDPVCGMTVDPKTAEKSIYKGKTYYFCARSEKEAFEKSPEKYVSHGRQKK